MLSPDCSELEFVSSESKRARSVSISVVLEETHESWDRLLKVFDVTHKLFSFLYAVKQGINITTKENRYNAGRSFMTTHSVLIRWRRDACFE